MYPTLVQYCFILTLSPEVNRIEHTQSSTQYREIDIFKRHNTIDYLTINLVSLLF